MRSQRRRVPVQLNCIRTAAAAAAEREGRLNVVAQTNLVKPINGI